MVYVSASEPVASLSGKVGTHPLRHGYRSTYSLSFMTPVNFPCVVTVWRMANDITYTMCAALPTIYVYIYI